MYLSRNRNGFGITLLPNRLKDLLAWCRTAEAAGFDVIGVADSQSLYREVFIACALAARQTERVNIGPRVIDPVTRHPAVAASSAATLAELAPGRALMGALRAYTGAVRDIHG